MVLACFDFEEVECIGESLDSFDCKPQLQRVDGVDASCFKILQDGDRYLSQDTCLHARIVDDQDVSDALLSSASICKQAASAPGRTLCYRNAMEELRQAEREAWQHRPCIDYLVRQEITAADRASVVDNMTRAATQLQLSSDVLYLGISCLDRCLSVLCIQPELLDATALACLWVAAKYEHCVVPPAVQFLAAASADFMSPASRQLLVDLEARVLQALDYRVCIYPTTKTFLRTIFITLQQQLQEQAKQQVAAEHSSSTACSGQIDPKLYFCASYLAEMSLLECKLVPFPHSHVAAAAFASANLLMGNMLQDAQLVALTGYSLSEIKLPMQWLLSVHHVLYLGRNLPVTSMYETVRKYRHASMCRVAMVPSISSTSDPRLRLCH